MEPAADITRPGRPPVLIWFRLYAGLMVLIYLLCIAFGLYLYSLTPAQLQQLEEPAEARITGVIMLVLGPALAALFAASFFLPRRRWVWVYDLVLICFGLTSCLFWPICIPLLIFWIRSGTRQWFHGSPSAAPTV